MWRKEYQNALFKKKSFQKSFFEFFYKIQNSVSPNDKLAVFPSPTSVRYLASLARETQREVKENGDITVLSVTEYYEFNLSFFSRFSKDHPRDQDKGKMFDCWSGG